MPVLPMREHPIVATALELARTWCEGHDIDGAPALTHAVRVATTVAEHQPAITPELIAAALLHDAPEFAPARGIADVAGILTARCSANVARIVMTLAVEHAGLDNSEGPQPPLADPDVLLVSAADKAVSLASVLQRSEDSDDWTAYWAARQPFLRLVPYFRRFSDDAAGQLPQGLADLLDNLVRRAERSATTAA